MNESLFPWAVSMIALVAIVANARKKVWCWPLRILANLLFCAYMLHKEVYPIAGLCLVYVGLSVYGWIQWSKGDHS